MNKRQILLWTGVTGLVTLVVLAGILFEYSGALAAPPAREAAAEQAQEIASPSYTSVSSLTFTPISPDIQYNKDTGRQLLMLPGPTRTSGNIFVAPLNLLDQRRLTSLTVFGEDFDNQGAVRLRLKRCDHTQARCLNIAEATSTEGYAAGQFQTSNVVPLNETVDNSRYSYLLELELTALSGSGLRSVRLEMGSSAPPPPSGTTEPWSLAENVRNFVIPNTGWSQVYVCTNDLSHLPNPTHYPTLIVDGKPLQLGSSMCVTVWGNNIEIRRELNTGPSSGTYRILR